MNILDIERATLVTILFPGWTYKMPKCLDLSVSFLYETAHPLKTFLKGFLSLGTTAVR